MAVPGTERTLTYFVAHLVKKGLRLRTIKVYLSAVRFWHIAKGKEDPFQTRMVRLQYMLQGVKREEASRWHSPRVRLPITPAILRKLKAVRSILYFE